MPARIWCHCAMTTISGMTVPGTVRTSRPAGMTTSGFARRGPLTRSTGAATLTVSCGTSSRRNGGSSSPATASPRSPGRATDRRMERQNHLSHWNRTLQRRGKGPRHRHAARRSPHALGKPQREVAHRRSRARSPGKRLRGNHRDAGRQWLSRNNASLPDRRASGRVAHPRYHTTRRATRSSYPSPR